MHWRQERAQWICQIGPNQHEQWLLILFLQLESTHAGPFNRNQCF